MGRITDLAAVPWPALVLSRDGGVLGSSAANALLGFEPRDVSGLEARFEVTGAGGSPLARDAGPWRRAVRGEPFEEEEGWRDRVSGLRHALRVRSRTVGDFGFLDIDPLPESRERRTYEDLLTLWTSLSDRASASEPIDLRNVLRRLVELACDLTGARYGALGVLDRTGSLLKDFVHHGVSEETARAIGHFPAGRGLLGAVIREGRSIRLKAIREDSRSEGFPPGHPAMTTFVGVPLRVGDAVFGNFYLADKQSGVEFTETDQQLLEKFSVQAGITVAFVRRLQDEERQLLEAVVEHAPYGLAYFPLDPALEPFGNAVALRMLGRVTRGDDPQCTFILRHPSGQALTGDEFPVARALREGAVINLEVLLERRELASIQWPTLISAAVVHSVSGAQLGVVVILQDITARKELEKLREDFTAIVAHDLRTPLQSVLLQVDLLMQQATGEAAMVPVVELQRMKANGRRLELLIRDLLDASRIEAQQVFLERRPLDLHRTVANLVSQIKAAFGAHPVTVEVAGDPPLAFADQFRIEQMLTNLLENAAKYSDDGTPIRIAISPEAGGVAISIEDRGPGIAPEAVPHLFDRYYQTMRARAARRGLGLGLYITRGLVEAHGGRISVNSVPGVGSTFRVWFPPGAPSDSATT